MSEKDKKQDHVDDNSRRSFLKNSGLTIGGLVIGGAFGGLLNMNNKPKAASNNGSSKMNMTQLTANPNVALMFFTQDQFNTTQAAADRIFPSDDNGPGAKELNAAIYIDHQLAGSYGINAKDYRFGPFLPGRETAVSQTRMLRKDIFLSGLAALDTYSQKNFKDKFQGLDAKKQDKVLTAFADGKVKLNGTTSTEFFNLLRILTIEGVYADPMYGGNQDMKGWSMRKYPGSRMSFTAQITNDKFENLKPESLNSHMSH
ncbi:gluconate 2-dehydrogenase subunit 3 family protein [Rummeliibacillus sp. JY-2-4R]